MTETQMGIDLPRDLKSSSVVESGPRILQVSTVDKQGGAAVVAWNLHQEYLERGFHSGMAVGYKFSDDHEVFLIHNDQYRGRWTRACYSAGDVLSPFVGRVKGAGRIRGWLREWIGQPRRQLAVQKGYEDFDFPGTWQLLNSSVKRPDLVHCHNLHGNYFDLRAIPWLSRQVPLVLTLHDAWLLSGHCAHSFDCDRWKSGCGRCPDLTIYPSIRRDATFHNWRRKKEIYLKSRFYVATPSRWLMQKVEQSMLAPAAVETRIIPNGVDLSVFYPRDKQSVREELDIPLNAKVILFAAAGGKKNTWKDYNTMKEAVALVAKRKWGIDLLFVVLGDGDPTENIGHAVAKFIPNISRSETMAKYYQAADVYIHAARADNFPNTILEALACGTPVVATAVGGIPEQVEDGTTGFLVPPRDSEGMAEAVIRLLIDDALRIRFGHNGAIDAERRFDLTRQVDEYIGWYREILKNRQQR